MGGLSGKNQQNKKEYVKANKIVGREMRCNICEKIFSSETNLNIYNSHIKNCQQNNRERNKLEILLNDLRETNLEIEQLEKLKRKKKEAEAKEAKKAKKEKINKPNIINTNNNNLSNNNQFIINSSDLIFFNQNVILNKELKNQNNYNVNTNEDNMDTLNFSDIDLNSLEELPFEEKLEFFKSYVKELKVDWREGSCKLEIDREDYFRESMIQFEKINSFKELKINFRGEVSHDAGGLIREWYTIIFKHLLSSEASMIIYF